ncbi:MAG: methionine synthase [Propionibacteriaceae bacterium]|jgi:hypothetical protein|nr:methionine synthase [Propionibacteriaceae bacterium]
MKATGLGSWPGGDPALASAQTAEAFPDCPFLPELPGRGAPAQMIGRALGLIDGLGFELTASGWATAAHRGRDQRRAAALALDDLDSAAERLEGWSGPYHVSLAGPWTLAAAVSRGGGEAVLADPGACRDLGQAWTEAAAAWHGRAARALPAAAVGLQVDEPLLPLVMAGGVRRASGLGRHVGADPARVAQLYGELPGALTAAGAWEVALHCCAPGLDVGLMGDIGFTALSFDAALLDHAARDGLAAWQERGGALWLGVLPTNRPAADLPSFDALLASTLRLLGDLGADPAAARTVLTPACGLAGFTVEAALAAARLLSRLAAAVEEEAAG